jgi:ABC-type bacteriocin/lantibiotic exporter with double-glycine peptidase domain
LPRGECSRQKRNLCDCTVLEATAALKAVDAAQASGFKGTRKRNLTFGDLISELERGLFPIAFVETLLPPHEFAQRHALVVIAIEGDEVKALDPARGEITFSKDEFLAEWNATRRLAILIEEVAF